MPRGGRGAPGGGLRLPPEMVRIARSIDAAGGADAGDDISVVIGRIEDRAVYELSCYVRACMMRTGFA